ncbi:MAG: hypothetical protein JW384_03496 [Nitrosomonadaceae bacterium]|nr:hypothetical protein [Nitrosomonadaceae bacterium]
MPVRTTAPGAVNMLIKYVQERKRKANTEDSCSPPCHTRITTSAKMAIAMNIGAAMEATQRNTFTKISRAFFSPETAHTRETAGITGAIIATNPVQIRETNLCETS